MSNSARGNYLLEGLRRLGSVALFLLQLLAQSLPALARPDLLLKQIYKAGARSLIIIMLSGLFVGMVLGLQGYDLLQRFGSEEALGIAAALGLLRELAPVITALLFAGRAGTALTSEIGLMRATDQLTAICCTPTSCAPYRPITPKIATSSGMAITPPMKRGAAT